ncbi:MAG TPA: hypothetical protein PKD68_02755 [Candidatus Saccharibacteria bacterium]|nr:hypothetical protein [Candidatus Saccharibacteria bacterium]
MSSNISLKQKSRTPRSPKHIALIILSCIAGAIVLLDLSPVGGNYKMYSKWVQCGQKPVAGNDFMGEHFFNDPPLYTPVDIFPPEEYFCTPEEAEAAGYEPPTLFREDNTEQIDERPYVP